MMTLLRDMNKRDLAAFKRVWGVGLNPGHTESLAEYVARTACKTTERISKRGVHLTTVHFPSGRVQEFETEHMATTYAFTV